MSYLGESVRNADTGRLFYVPIYVSEDKDRTLLYIM